MATLPKQDYENYARILNKRDGQTVRYRWKVILRRAKGACSRDSEWNTNYSRSTKEALVEYDTADINAVNFIFIFIRISGKLGAFEPSSLMQLSLITMVGRERQCTIYIYKQSTISCNPKELDQENKSAWALKTKGYSRSRKQSAVDNS